MLYSINIVSRDFQHQGEREEMLDSKTGESNNYFSDPMAAAMADVIESLKDAESIGTLIHYIGIDSKFENIDPPLSSETREAEKKDLKFLKFLHPDKAKLFDELIISFEFEKPFEEDKQTKWASVGETYSNGIISLRTAVKLLGITNKPDQEVEQILLEASWKTENRKIEPILAVK